MNEDDKLLEDLLHIKRQFNVKLEAYMHQSLSRFIGQKNTPELRREMVDTLDSILAKLEGRV